jgi:hypothetical protein
MPNAIWSLVIAGPTQPELDSRQLCVPSNRGHIFSRDSGE